MELGNPPEQSDKSVEEVTLQKIIEQILGESHKEFLGRRYGGLQAYLSEEQVNLDKTGKISIEAARIAAQIILDYKEFESRRRFLKGLGLAFGLAGLGGVAVAELNSSKQEKPRKRLISKRPEWAESAEEEIYESDFYTEPLTDEEKKRVKDILRYLLEKGVNIFGELPQYYYDTPESLEETLERSLTISAENTRNHTLAELRYPLFPLITAGYFFLYFENNGNIKKISKSKIIEKVHDIVTRLFSHTELPIPSDTLFCLFLLGLGNAFDSRNLTWAIRNWNMDAKIADLQTVRRWINTLPEPLRNQLDDFIQSGITGIHGLPPRIMNIIEPSLPRDKAEAQRTSWQTTQGINDLEALFIARML
ncbi:MAG: hypothetical protein KatS3mg090_0552 [Patescibacteria group bacterium]|nr:MAG: hypothetical protein KatS3mg090_0552 [Patescibacteria group bacterium]